MIDLTGEAAIVTTWIIDPISFVVTLTFKNADESVNLGSVALEGARFRSMMKALDGVSQELFPDGSPATGQRTVYSSETGKSTTVFG